MATGAGCRATRFPIPVHTRESSRPGWPYRGIRGQNAARPKTSSSAGRKVTWASRAAAIDTAPTGPRPCSEADCAASRQTMAQTTVPAEASRVGRVRRSATAMASAVAAW